MSIMTFIKKFDVVCYTSSPYYEVSASPASSAGTYFPCSDFSIVVFKAVRRASYLCQSIKQMLRKTLQLMTVGDQSLFLSTYVCTSSTHLHCVH